MKSVKPVFVLDACALLRLAQAEPGMVKVQDYLYKAQLGECTVLMHLVNLGEVVCRIGKSFGWPVAERKRDEISLLPIEVVPFEEELFWSAVRLKSGYAISYADAFAAALAIDRKATLLSADPEFGALGEKLSRIVV